MGTTLCHRNRLRLLVLLVVTVVAFPSICDCRRYHSAEELSQELNQIRKRLDNAFRGAKSCQSELDLEAQKWMEDTDQELRRLFGEEAVDNWNYLTNITNDNAVKLEVAVAELDDWTFNKTEKANYYLHRICHEATIRQLRFFTHTNSVPVAKNVQTRRQLTQMVNKMQEIYSTTNVTKDGKNYRLDPELNHIMAKSRDYDELLWAWNAWHTTVGRKLKKIYADFVGKMNEAAKDNGYPDIGIYWQLNDFDQDNIEAEMDRLYGKLKPFYEKLHAYVRYRLATVYSKISPDGCLPAHLLGNMWAQEWVEIADIVMPYPNASFNYNVTKSMLEQGYTPDRLFRMAEEFFTSIGLESMTPDFWNKSVMVRPADNRPMECHASAEDFYRETDFRIKMCAEVKATDFQTVHHEMGHIEYFMLYRNQPTVFRTGANAAFHEAVGDTIALSVMTDAHLAAVGLIKPGTEQPTPTEAHEQEINFLLRMALEKIAFIPFGYSVDKWRYKLFRGEIAPDDYTSTWWQIRENFEGLCAPLQRSKDDFDPGAKFHIPANVGYSRYFFSFIGQFQFHSALCKLAGHVGPLHMCDIYRSKTAGQKLRSVLSLGASRPWSEVMQEFTGQNQFEVNAILEYFKPLIDWLEKESVKYHVGWQKKKRKRVKF